jgi:hypothetical protein
MCHLECDILRNDWKEGESHMVTHKENDSGRDIIQYM